MIIKVKNYTDGIHNFSFEESAEKIGLKDPFYNGLKLEVKMDKSNSQIVFDCDLTTKVKLDCDRCLEEYQTELNSEFLITYLIGTDDSSNDFSESDNVYYLSPETDKIDLSQDVYDYAKLALPMKNLCDVECKGLCTKCGKNLNEGKCDCKDDVINPVWEKLLTLKNKNDKNTK